MKEVLLLFFTIFSAILLAQYVYKKFIKRKFDPYKDDPYYSRTYEDPHGDGG